MRSPSEKTNLDQFATGLVGTRSPYGEVHNAYDDKMISGGSSSGSAVSVALGMAAFRSVPIRQAPEEYPQC